MPPVYVYDMVLKKRCCHVTATKLCDPRKCHQFTTWILRGLLPGLGLKNLAMLLSYFDYIFVHLRQKVRLRPKLSPKFLSTLGRTRPEKPCMTYNSELNALTKVTQVQIDVA